METFSYQLLETLPDAAILVRDNRVLNCNETAARLLADPEHRDLPAPLADILSDLDGAEGGIGACELGGSEYRVSVSGTRQGERLLVLTPRLKDADGIMESLSQQLRQCLGDLNLAAQLLAPAVRAQREPGADRNFFVLNQSICRLLRMIRHLELKGTLGERRADTAVLDLVELCSGLVDEAQPLAAMAGIQLFYESRLIVLPLMASRELVESLVLNLISNAIKAAGEGGEVCLRLSKSGGRAILTVEDSGGGSADLSELFRSGANSLQPGRGLGLGLPLVQGIVACYGGTVLAVSSGRGMRITASLPMRVQEEGVTLRSAVRPSEGGIPNVLVELSDALPARAFSYYDME